MAAWRNCQTYDPSAAIFLSSIDARLPDGEKIGVQKSKFAVNVRYLRERDTVARAISNAAPRNRPQFLPARFGTTYLDTPMLVP
jgi:hypothetical protein